MPTSPWRRRPGEALITHNEPFVVVFPGIERAHAPGVQDPAVACAVRHHLLLSHGYAVRALRDAVPDAQVGITLDLYPVHPASDSRQDREAAARFDGVHNRI